MDTWQTEWTSVEEVADFESSYNTVESDVNTEFEENVDSPIISKNVVENNGEDKSDKNDSKVISTALAKRRLQAYSNKMHPKKVPTKDEKREDEKQDNRSPMKKSKKALYPDERAKAVINEIEEIKKKEAHEEWMSQEQTRVIVAAAIKSITNKCRTTSRSSSSEKESHFKKRDISSRNYRRTDSYKSHSPERENRKSSKSKYPKNWSDYKEQRLTVVKDTQLKKKLLNLSSPSKSDLCLQLYNFNTPSHLLEPFKFIAQDESYKEIPISFIRVTKTRPQLTFSINCNNNKNSFVSRAQLFQMISTERRQLIEKLINTPSKLNSSSKKIQTRHWYHKSWKKSGDAECKILENSVGLSFLQNYSDEEEENDEEQIVICSSAKTKKVTDNRVRNEINEQKFEINNEIEDTDLTQKLVDYKKKHLLVMSNVVKSDEINKEKVKVNERGDFEPGEIIDETDNKIGEYTPEKKNEHIETPNDDFYETRKAIEELEEQLVKKSSKISDSTKNGKSEGKHKENSSVEQNDKKDRKKKNKKKPKKKVESNLEDEEVLDKPKNKKRKKKLKKKYSSSEEEDSSEEEEKRKRKNKKKIKLKKDKKKMKNKTDNDSKISKSKKKDDTSEEDTLKLEKKKKKKIKVKTEEENDKSNTEQDSKKKRKRKKIKKTKDNYSADEPNDEQNDSDTDKYIKKKKSPHKTDENKKKLKEDKCDRIKSKIVDNANLDQGNVKSDQHNEENNLNKSRKRKRSLHDEDIPTVKEKKSKNESKEKVYTVPSEISVKKDINRKKPSEDVKTKHTDKLNNLKEKGDGDKCKSKKNKENTSTKEEPVMEDNEKEKKIHKKKSKEKEHSIIEDDFPIEKDTYEINVEQKEIKTPATEEYRENWERDPLWQTEEEMQPKKSQILNTSWESDEEVFEEVVREPEKPRSHIENFDLEIPLNIKPFKRREKIDSDIELQRLKFESKCLSEERRQLEIEKMKVKELELEVMKEVQVVKNEIEHNYTQNKSDIEKPRRHRWDKKIAEPKKSNIQNFDNFDIVKESQTNELKFIEPIENDTSAVLENEYEEFMKSLCSRADGINIKAKNTSSCIDLTQLEEENVEISKIGSTPDIHILPKDVPFIPMPDEIESEKESLQLPQGIKMTLNEIRPVPVPSPQVDIDIIPKPLINLSLSTNITLDIASKIDSPNHSSLNILKPPLPIHVPNVLKNEDVVSSSSIETINYDFKDVDISASSLSPEVQSENLSIVPNSSLNEQEVALTHANDNISSSTTDIILTTFNDRETANHIDLGIKPFSFSGMVLPTKKVLLNNSNLNLGDSDDENSSLKNSKVQIEQMSKINSIVFGDVPIHSIRENVQLLESEKVAKQNLPQYDYDQTNIIKEHDKKIERSRSPTIKPRDSRMSSRREDSPKRIRREPSPRRRRNESPRRDRRSPLRRFSSPGRRRSPVRRRSPPAKRRQLSRRSRSPVYRRRSISPRRKSPRSNSPRCSTVKRIHSKSPDKLKFSSGKAYQSPEKTVFESNKIKSPVTVTSPLERLKRSVADSTISDDLLPQPSSNLEEFSDSPIPQFYKNIISPANVSLDLSMNEMLNHNRNTKQIDDSYKTYYDQYSHIQQYVTNSASSDLYTAKPCMESEVVVQNYLNDIVNSQNSFVQMGNMVQIVPTDIPIKVEVLPPEIENPPIIHKEKSQIVQMGNVLEIVPTDFSPNIIHNEEPKIELTEVKYEEVVQEKIEKQSAEEMMKIKTAERRAEREKRRLDKERKRKEKEKRREEKEKQRQIKMKQKTENMIKQALQLEVEGLGEEEELTLNETPTQWPPVPILSGVSKEFSRGILIRTGIVKRDKSRLDKRKVVQFADGVRPGEGTSPSGGEELSSPPPRIVLPKEKRYTKTKFHNKSQKKKVKVKIIKKLPEPESDEDDNLPPPSPPPGSPPPHIFPPRVKTPMINNIHPYVTTIAGVQTAPTVQPQTQNHQQIFRQQTVSLIMVPPPPPPHHPPSHHHIPPPPPHHGPPPPHHHGPPPPHHHGPPPPHHHGPPPPHHHPPPPGPPFHRPPFHR